MASSSGGGLQINEWLAMACRRLSRTASAPEASAGVVEFLSGVRQEGTAEVIGIVSDRFERRLVEETSKLRVDIGSLRHEMAGSVATVRQEMTGGFAAVRQEMADLRFDLLKWAFLFWVGQFFAVASLVLVLVRFLDQGP